MPELPSVERGRRLLEDYLVNKKIIDVNANYGFEIKWTLLC